MMVPSLRQEWTCLFPSHMMTGAYQGAFPRVLFHTSRRSASPFFVPEVVLAEALRKTVGVEPMALGIP
jgi:hypothetical protein